MRTAPPALIAFLASRQPCYKADLFTFTFKDGSINYWTSFDQNVIYGGTTWVAQGLLLQRSSLSVKNTIEVPELQIALFALDTDFVGGLQVKTALHNGQFDGATVALDRAFMPTPGDMSLGQPVNLFTGQMSKADITAVGATLTIKGANVRMNQSAPRNQYQKPCIHTFCDAGCGLNPATFTITNTVGASPSVSLIPWGSVPGTPANYTLGKLTMTSGSASGQVRTVKFADASGLQLVYPLYDLPIAGDTFSVLEGDDRTQTTCNTRFANLGKFRGFPYIPQAEQSI